MDTCRKKGFLRTGCSVAKSLETNCRDQGCPMSISKTMQNIPPVLVLFLSLLIGVAMALTSAAVHVSVASFADPAKQLGYFSEINWSLNFILFVPLALFF